MKIFGVAGWSGSGKTTLMLRLVPALVRRGVRVATLKHTHHDLRFQDCESMAALEAGAVQAVALSSRRAVMMTRAEAVNLKDLLTRVRDADLVLVEGWKRSGIEKIEIVAPGANESPLHLCQPQVVAVACDFRSEVHGLPCFRRDDVEAIADFILSRIGC